MNNVDFDIIEECCASVAGMAADAASFDLQSEDSRMAIIDKIQDRANEMLAAVKRFKPEVDRIHKLKNALENAVGIVQSQYGGMLPDVVEAPEARDFVDSAEALLGRS